MKGRSDAVAKGLAYVAGGYLLLQATAGLLLVAGVSLLALPIAILDSPGCPYGDCYQPLRRLLLLVAAGLIVLALVPFLTGLWVFSHRLRALLAALGAEIAVVSAMSILAARGPDNPAASAGVLIPPAVGAALVAAALLARRRANLKPSSP